MKKLFLLLSLLPLTTFPMEQTTTKEYLLAIKKPFTILQPNGGSTVQTPSFFSQLCKDVTVKETVYNPQRGLFIRVQSDTVHTKLFLHDSVTKIIVSPKAIEEKIEKEKKLASGVRIKNLDQRFFQALLVQQFCSNLLELYMLAFSNLQ